MKSINSDIITLPPAVSIVELAGSFLRINVRDADKMIKLRGAKYVHAVWRISLTRVPSVVRTWNTAKYFQIG